MYLKAYLIEERFRSKGKVFHRSFSSYTSTCSVRTYPATQPLMFSLNGNDSRSTQQENTTSRPPTSLKKDLWNDFTLNWCVVPDSQTRLSPQGEFIERRRHVSKRPLLLVQKQRTWTNHNGNGNKNVTKCYASHVTLNVIASERNRKKCTWNSGDVVSWHERLGQSLRVKF